MNRRIMLILSLFISAAAWAQAPASVAVTIDGTMAQSEYAAVATENGMTMAARLSADGATLYLAISAQTEGWVSIGVGSAKMDGSLMILGYAAGGTPSVSYELGKGRSHAPAPVPGADAVVVESGGMTTLEVSLPAGTFASGGRVQLIGAFGKKDDFRSLHSKRAALELRL